MNPKVEFAANTLSIDTVKWPAILSFWLGGVVFFCGLAIYLRFLPLDIMFFHFFLAGGLVFLATGFLILTGRQAIYLTVNSSRGVLEIKNCRFLCQNTTNFPLSYFSRILVLHDFQLGRKGDVDVNFQVALESRSHSFLTLLSFKQKEEAFSFVEQLRQILLLDVFYLNELYKQAEFNQKIEHVPEEIDFAARRDMRIVQKESEIVLQWKNRQNGIFLFSLFGLVYAFFHLMFFVFYPVLPWSYASWQSILPMACAGGIFLILILSRYTSVYNLHLGRESVRFTKKKFGFIVLREKMFWDDVTELHNNLTGRDFKIVSHNGCEILEELNSLLAEGGTASFDEETIRRLGAMRGETLRVFVESLDITDRIRIEQEILNFML